MRAQILSEVENLREDLIQDIIKLVKINSIRSKSGQSYPYGIGIHECLHAALSISSDLGFNTRNIDEQMGYASYGQGEGYIAAVGHIDVVEIKNEKDWKYPPFKGVIKDNRIYGRGVLDNKGPILCCLYGLYALKRLGIEPKHELRVIYGCNEETGMADVPIYLSKENPPLMGWTPDCKYPAVYTECGRITYTIKTSLTEADYFHSLIKQYFINHTLGDSLGIAYQDELGILELLGFEEYKDKTSLFFKFVVSYPASCKFDFIDEQIREKLQGIEIEMNQFLSPVYHNPKSPLCTVLGEVYTSITGLSGTPVSTRGGTYAKVMPNIVAFGPSLPNQKGISHLPNEWMDIDDIIMNAKIYALSFYELGCK